MAHSHAHLHAHSASEVRHKKARNITLIGALVNLILAIAKMLGGWFGHSHALFADGVHSVADLFADALVVLASKIGNQAADSEHPYGHRRIETAATVVVAAFLFIAGIAIIDDSIQHLYHGMTTENLSQWVLWIAIVSLLINEIIYQITKFIAKEIKSQLLLAHAWHRRSDAAASLVVLIGIAGAMMGWPHLDSIAAIIVGLLIIKMAYQMGRQSIDELVDRGLDEETKQAVETTIKHVEGVRALHQLRTRMMGGNVMADVHVLVDSHISVSEGHYISDHVYQALKHKFPQMTDVIVHVDPEDDEHDHDHVTLALPSRKKILKFIEKNCDELPGCHALQLLAIHYLANQIELEIALPIALLEKYSYEKLQTSYLETLKGNLSELKLKLYFFV